jgi:hypothetical protein
MASFRALPRVGGRADIVHAGSRRPVHIVAVEGRSLRVVDAEDETTTFTLNPLTGHWVREGDPYWGMRLMLNGP